MNRNMKNHNTFPPSGGNRDYKGASNALALTGAAKSPTSKGGAKGSSVYVNFKAYTDKEVEEFK